MVWNTLPIRGASNPKGLRASMRPKGENIVLVTSRKPDDPLLSRGFCWSGRRDSNPRPSPWQGDALPAELRPRQNETIAVMGQFDASGFTRQSAAAGRSAA